MNHFDNQFLTYAVALHDWINQPGYVSLFLLGFQASINFWLFTALVVSGKLVHYVVTARLTPQAMG